MSKEKTIIGLAVFSTVFALIIGYYAGSKKSDQLNESEISNLATYKKDGQIKEIKMQDVIAKIGNQFQDYDKMVYQQKKQAIYDIIENDFRNSMDLTKIDVPKILDAEINQVLLAQKLDRKKVTAKQLADLVGNLTIGKRRELEKSIVLEKSKSSDLKLLMPPPFRLRKNIDRGNELILGDKTSPNAILFFGSTHCAQCKEVASKMKNLKESFAKDFSFYFKYSGQDLENSAAFRTAKALFCTAQQNPEKVAPLFAQAIESTPMDDEGIYKLTSQAEIEPKELQKCMDNKEINLTLKKFAAANNDELGYLKSEPTLSINGILLSALEPLDLIVDVVRFTQVK